MMEVPTLWGEGHWVTREEATDVEVDAFVGVAVVVTTASVEFSVIAESISGSVVLMMPIPASALAEASISCGVLEDICVSCNILPLLCGLDTFGGGGGKSSRCTNFRR